MSPKPVKETDLFKQTLIFLLDGQRDDLEEMKTKVSLERQVKMDNSAMLRGMIEYFKDHPEAFDQMVDYALEMKGFRLIEKMRTLFDDGASLQTIEKEMGIGIEVSKEIKKRLQETAAAEK